MTRPDDNVVQWVYASRNGEELAERYNEWAKSYDQDLDRDFGWVGPLVAVETVMKFVPGEARILDAGAGTGLVGQLLFERGYAHLVAIDFSQGMLDEARKKRAYEELHQMDMASRLGFESDSFDAVISVGVFTVGHVTSSALDELIRVTRPGGHVVFTLRPDVYESGFKEKHADLEARGKWKLVEASEPVRVLPKGEPDVFHQVWVYQVSS